jgi:hypothetical protein
MKTQAWAWLTAGVVALGLNGFYHDGGAEWAHQVADRISDQSAAVAERVSGRAEQFLENAGMVAARSETASCRLSTALARAQTKMARAQNRFAHFRAMSDRNGAQVVELEMNQAQIEQRVEAQLARVQFASAVVNPVQVRVVCPRVRVNVPVVRIPRIEIPEINVPEIRIPEVRIPRVSIPHVSIPRLPVVRIPAPVIADADSDNGPI